MVASYLSEQLGLLGDRKIPSAGVGSPALANPSLF